VEVWLIVVVLILFTVGRLADALTRIGPAREDPAKRRRLNWIWAGALVACIAVVVGYSLLT